MLKALTVIPGKSDSAAIQDRSAALAGRDEVVVKTLCVGVCGTDAEILSGRYGWSRPGTERLVIGHEAVGVVERADQSKRLSVGDLVVPIVRRPDPVPCGSCAVGEFDMCRNGQYQEHGIKELDGFCVEQFSCGTEQLVCIDPALGFLGVLVEPTSIVAKAWSHIFSIGRRAHFAPQQVLITGAGPIGLLAALLARQRGLPTTVFDRVTSGAKPLAVQALGARYCHEELSSLLSKIKPDIIIECTGADPVVLEVMRHNARGGIVCLVGVSAAGRPRSVDIASLNRSFVLENDVVFGSVNANRSHYEQAAAALRQADPSWLYGLISRRVPLDRWQEAFERRDGHIKVVIDMPANGILKHDPAH